MTDHVPLCVLLSMYDFTGGVFRIIFNQTLPHGIIDQNPMVFFCIRKSINSHEILNTQEGQADDGTWVPPSHHELVCIAKYSRVKHEAICPTAKAWLKLGHATEQWSEPNQLIYSRIAVNQKNQHVAVVESQSEPEPD